jgi:serine/threonine protein kinase
LVRTYLAHIISGHYALWKKGIEHGDISLENLMLHPNLDVGVLNDFDLVYITGWPARGGRRTGTVAFMALDLLTEKAIKHRFARLYRHDAESLIWVLAWVCLIIEVNDDIPEGMDQGTMSRQILRLHTWKVPSTSALVRNECLNQYDIHYQPSKCFEKLWILAMRFFRWLSSKLTERKEHVERVFLCEAEGAFPEPSEDHVYQEIVNVIKSFEATPVFALLT